MTKICTSEKDRGTSLTSSYPWGLIVKARALCSDGKVRAVKVATTADTFFSIPGSVKVSGKSVSGFVSFDRIGDEDLVLFTAYTYGKNGDLLPGFPGKVAA